MALPFTLDQFHAVFRDYNTAVWPAQWLLGAFAVAAVGAALRPQPWSGAVVFIAFALVVYPVWSAYAGHPYPETPSFGLPCPTTIYTIGLLCFAVSPTPRSPLIGPLLWSLVGAQAALFLGVQPDLDLIAAGVVGAALLATAHRPLRTLKS